MTAHFPCNVLNLDMGSGAAGPKFTDEVTDAIDKGIAGGGSRLRSTRRDSLCGCRRGCAGSNSLAFYAALENERGPHSDVAHQNDHPRIDFRLDFGAGIVDQRWDKDLVDGFFPSGGRFRSRGLGLGVRIWLGALLVRFLGGYDLADFGLWWRS